MIFGIVGLSDTDSSAVYALIGVIVRGALNGIVASRIERSRRRAAGRPAARLVIAEFAAAVAYAELDPTDRLHVLSDNLIETVAWKEPICARPRRSAPVMRGAACFSSVNVRLLDSLLKSFISRRRRRANLGVLAVNQ